MNSPSSFEYEIFEIGFTFFPYLAVYITISRLNNNLCRVTICVAQRYLYKRNT